MFVLICGGIVVLGLVALAYTYVGYPLVLFSLRRLGAAEVERHTTQFPSVTMVIPAHNEASVVVEKIENTREIDYPGDFRCLFVSDSTDRTDELIRDYAPDWMELLSLPERRGKSYAINEALETVASDVVVFSDANTMYENSAVTALVQPLADDQVGCVTGQLRLDDPEGDGTEGLYWRYELMLRRLEAILGTTVSVNGGLLAFRREDLHPLPERAMTDDFVLAMRQAVSGRRVFFEETAVGFENTAGSVFDEFSRRVRIGAGNYQALVWFADLLIPWRVGGRASLQFTSHCFLRWVAPWILVSVFVATVGVVGLTDSVVAWLFLSGQVFAYLVAIAGLASERLRTLTPVRIPAYFVAMNAALGLGALQLFFGDTNDIWTVTDRQ